MPGRSCWVGWWVGWLERAKDTRRRENCQQPTKPHDTDEWRRKLELCVDGKLANCGLLLAHAAADWGWEGENGLSWKRVTLKDCWIPPGSLIRVIWEFSAARKNPILPPSAHSTNFCENPKTKSFFFCKLLFSYVRTELLPQRLSQRENMHSCGKRIRKFGSRVFQRTFPWWLLFLPLFPRVGLHSFPSIETREGISQVIHPPESMRLYAMRIYNHRSRSIHTFIMHESRMGLNGWP